MKALVLLLLLSLSSWAGNDVENGGDAVAFEFTMTVRLALESLNGFELDPELKKVVQKIHENLKSIEVSSKPVLHINEREVDAINYPLQKRILVSRTRWKLAKLAALEARLGLVLHEYLGVLQFDDQDYSISQKLVEALFETSLDQFMAKESFAYTAEDLAMTFWSCRLIPESKSKEVCIFAGEVNAKVQSLSEWTKNYPTWFRPEVITNLGPSLKTVTEEILENCLREEDRKSLLESCQRGYDLTKDSADLLFAK